MYGGHAPDLVAGSSRVRPHTHFPGFGLSWRGSKQRIPMPLVSTVITLIIVGVALWLINRFIPMAGAIKTILNLVVVIAVVLWLLYGFGILNHSGTIHLPSP